MKIYFDSSHHYSPLERHQGGVARYHKEVKSALKTLFGLNDTPQGGNRMCAILVLVLALMTTLAFADEAATLFQQGNQAYQAGDYEQAAAAFERIIALEKENWQVYYNLGNAYFKQRKTGLAILNYERALRRNRSNEDLQFNLDLANLAITDRILEPPRSVVVAWLTEALNFFSHEQAAGWALVFWWGALLGLIFFWAGKHDALRRVGRVSAWSFGALCLFFALVFATQWYKQSTEQFGIVMEQRVVARSSPGADATEVFIIHEGAKVKLQEQNGAWQRIRLADGKVGWLKAESLAKI